MIITIKNIKRDLEDQDHDHSIVRETMFKNKVQDEEELDHHHFHRLHLRHTIQIENIKNMKIIQNRPNCKIQIEDQKKETKVTKSMKF